MQEIVKEVNWSILGPVLTGLIVILVIVFGFILKLNKNMYKKLGTPGQANIAGAETVVLEKVKFDKLFNHENRLSSTETKVKSLCDKFDNHREENVNGFKAVFQRLDVLKGLMVLNNPGPQEQFQERNSEGPDPGIAIKRKVRRRMFRRQCQECAFFRYYKVFLSPEGKPFCKISGEFYNIHEETKRKCPDFIHRSKLYQRQYQDNNNVKEAKKEERK